MLTNFLGVLARSSFRHHRLVLSLAALLIAACAAVGLSSGGTAAERAETMAQKFGAGPPDLVLYSRPGRSVDLPAVAEQGRRVTELLSGHPWSPPRCCTGPLDSVPCVRLTERAPCCGST
ncbi:hypothetical protein ACWDZ8_18355 [Streptomyces sp. NPDC003233]